MSQKWALTPSPGPHH
ncbi:hypothetical protein LI950_02770 [Cutibacterium acnes]|nr:hypothetical protein [Cutibacterium acnes]UBS52341.1 hypothetical protein LCQ46_05245 [Cutibacterium acnes subsp. acnes]MCD1042276.1 hypothetical protein [Cutibacterium acnes]MCD1045688.1 hypothetical protein [Cutibacterium acnes]MCD1054527.1 hypothetical protein [Cutibacterium acnes]